MIRPSHLALAWLLACLPTGCSQEEPEVVGGPDVACPQPYACTGAAAPTFLLLGFHPWQVTGGDFATWRFERDNEVCEISPEAISCFVRGQPDDGSVPLFVAANITSSTGIERRFRLDLTGHANAHIRVYRDHQIADDFDSVPAYQTDEACPDFRSDLLSERWTKLP